MQHICFFRVIVINLKKKSNITQKNEENIIIHNDCKHTTRNELWRKQESL